MQTRIRDLEELLRLAMLHSDVAALDRLISDDLLFVGLTGATFGKQDDLELHRSGRQKLDQADWEDVTVEAHESSAISVVTACLSGTLDGIGFSGRFKYLRMWVRFGDTWKVAGGSVTAVAS